MSETNSDHTIDQTSRSSTIGFGPLCAVDDVADALEDDAVETQSKPSRTVRQDIPSSRSTNEQEKKKKLLPLVQYWSFRFTASKVIEKELIDFFAECEWIVEHGFQLEAGKRKGTEHFQGAFEVFPRKRFNQLDETFRGMWPKLIFDGKDYLQKSMSKAADRYGMKKDTRIRGPWYKGERFEGIAKETVYRVDITLRPWQQWICTNVLDIPGDHRSIYLFWEPCGGLGKTTFQKWIHMNYPGVIVLGGKSADMKNGIIEYYEKNKTTPETILINLPMTFDTQYFCATGTEECKDMFFYSGKFHGGMVNERPPRFMIFANTNNLGLSQMASDRWIIVRLPDGPGASGKPKILTLDEDGRALDEDGIALEDAKERYENAKAVYENEKALDEDSDE